MSETKICETCKNEAKEQFDFPCNACVSASNWESRQIGCDFCNEEGSIVEVRYGEVGTHSTATIRAGFLTTKFRVKSDNTYTQAYKINYCPLCGRKL